MNAPATATPEIVYPESDGEPMGDNSHQIDLIIALFQSLTDHFAGRPDVAVHTNLIWYPVQGRPKLCRAPDVMVAFDRPRGRRRSYKQWEEDGIAPQVVFEIYAPGNKPQDLLDKFFFYERFGVEEYYFFDPDSPGFTGWWRVGGAWTEIESIHGFTSPRLGLTFDWAGGDGFELLGPDGRPIRTHEELRQAFEEEQTRADREREKAEQERQRADRLAAELRNLGVDPDRLGTTGGAP